MASNQVTAKEDKRTVKIDYGNIKMTPKEFSKVTPNAKFEAGMKKETIMAQQRYYDLEAKRMKQNKASFDLELFKEGKETVNWAGPVIIGGLIIFFAMGPATTIFANMITQVWFIPALAIVLGILVFGSKSKPRYNFQRRR